MQESGIDSQKTFALTGLALEVAQEQAESLGLAGKKLGEAIDRFRASADRTRSEHEKDELVSEIASRAWGLMVQRELIGFRHENVRWVLDHFEIPEPALKRLGWRHEDDEAAGN